MKSRAAHTDRQGLVRLVLSERLRLSSSPWLERTPLRDMTGEGRQVLEKTGFGQPERHREMGWRYAPLEKMRRNP